MEGFFIILLFILLFITVIRLGKISDKVDNLSNRVNDLEEKLDDDDDHNTEYYPE